MKKYEIDHNRYDKYFQGIKLMRKKMYAFWKEFGPTIRSHHHHHYVPLFSNRNNDYSFGLRERK